MPPDECPAAYTAEVALWDKEPLDILKAQRVPWMVIAKLAEEGWVTLSHLANRFRDEADLSAHAPTELGFLEGQNHYVKNDERRAWSGLMDAWKTANKIKKSRTETIHINPNADPALIMVAGQRESMERVYEQQTGSRPPLDNQGSDHFLGCVFKECSRGSIGAFNTKEIVPKIPDPHTYMNHVV